MPNQASPSNANPPEALIEAIEKILRKLARLLLEFSIAFPQLAELLKKAYVAAAEKEFALDNKQQTVSRLSALTGIHRKEIKRLRNQDVDKEKAPEMVSIGVRLVARWISEPTYLSEQGIPRALPFKSKPGEPSFEALVQDELKKDIHPRAMLDAWLSLGVVSIDKDKIITLNAQSYIPSKGLEDKAFFFGLNLADHIAAGTHNLLDKKPACFDRCVYYDSLTVESIEELRSISEKRGEDTIKELNELAMSLRTKDMAKKENKHRINVGLFVYHEQEE